MPFRRHLISRTSHTLTVALVLAVLPATATAQGRDADPSPADPALADEMATLLDRAVERFAAGDLEAAREAFAAAWRLRKDVTIASNLADVEMKLGRYRDAAEHLTFCIRHATEVAARKDAERRLAECRPFVATATVTVDTQAATVLLDGAPVGHAPLEGELWLQPGAHTLKAQLQGRSSPEKTLQVRGGEEQRIELKLSPTSAPSPSPQPAPVAPLVQVQGRRRADVTTTHDSELKFYTIVGGAALGAAGLGLGLLWTFNANSEEESARSLLAQVNAEGDPELAKAGRACTGSSPPRGCADLKPAWQSVDRSRNLATGAFVIGGVLLAGTAAAYIFWPEHREPTERAAVHVAPWSQGKANGVQLSGSF
jgi:hypothetical protein